MYRLLSLFVLAILVTNCTFVQERYPTLPPGPYRGILELEYNPIVPNPKGAPIAEKTDLEFDEVLEGALPFTFDVVYETDTTFRMEIHNGEETIIVPAADIVTGRDQLQGRDTIRIDFPVYDTHISAYHEENVIEGVWVVHYRDNYRIPFKGYFGKGHRFTPLRKEPTADISGTWEVMFSDKDSEYPGIAEFTQNKNHLTGTFRTETGDYRYLEGTVQGNKAYLSVFDGSHAFLFEAKIGDDGSLVGTFRSGRHYIANWKATRNAEASLADPDNMTRMVDGTPLKFSFQNSKGELVSLDDERYQGKPKLIKIMGTWCPNCMDEAVFLKEYLQENETQDLEVIALAFERYGADDERSMAAIRRYEENMDVPWPVLLAGSSDKTEAGKALPMLSKVISYPTLLFVDRNNQVTRIHTGFNGPATSQYADFKRSFDTSVRELLEGDASK
ncbi:TlpA disulfide reductase family protein [Lewinella sp. 4G2]|uniref:TlpA disulfide reductase family protein n=1 Tax=Lewinella sp. 4G2 TaxID=1803372 RepID=UPI0007B4D660|nr:TlpA disulfide reductase family protein [Lewinella sp. 4G2]OAV46041.1 alkyl hydroperoxide reductase [Lewinella sp. 4G2]